MAPISPASQGAAKAPRGRLWRLVWLAGRSLLIALASLAFPASTLSSVSKPPASAADAPQSSARLRLANAEAGRFRSGTVLSTPSQLASALAAARDGDRIVLAPGHYGPLSLRNKRFARAVTLTSADPRRPATFSSVRVLGVHGLTMQDIRVKFTPDAGTIQSHSAVFVKNSSAISFTQNSLVGGPAVSGMPESTPAGQLGRSGNVLGRPAARAATFSTSQDVTFSGNDVSVFHTGVVLDRVTGVVFARNVIHDLRTTPLAGRQVSRVRIEGNHFHSFRPWRFGGAGDHGDLIHFYTMAGAEPSRDIVIRANWLEQGDGDPLLGIYLDDNKLNIGFLDVTIEHNLILNGNHQGIRLENVQGLVRNNTLALPRGGEPKKAPQILAVQNSNIVAAKNVLAKITIYPGSVVKEQDNLLIPVHGRGGNPYSRVFVDASASEPTPRHFGLRRVSRGSSVGADMSLISAQLAGAPGRGAHIPN